MKICVAQTHPITGDIEQNIKNHKIIIDLAAAQNVDMIIFPELSLTGYEPTLAAQLAADVNDTRLDIFQNISDNKHITIGVGLPTTSSAGTNISLILFQPHQKRQTYCKHYLHRDEEPFFAPGPNLTAFKIGQSNVALAICYEISVSEHEKKTFKCGPEIYIASVAKFIGGIDDAQNRLSELAHTHSVPVLMSNCVGISDGAECVGKTSAWDNNGKLVGQLDGTREGILIFDTESQTTSEVLI